MFVSRHFWVDSTALLYAVECSWLQIESAVHPKFSMIFRSLNMTCIPPSVKVTGIFKNDLSFNICSLLRPDASTLVDTAEIFQANWKVKTM